MLEDYYVKPSTVDRVRASWLAPQIESYLEWLESHRYSRLVVYRRLPLLFHFAEFAQKKGCKDVASCKPYIKEFVSQWLEQHGANAKTAVAVRKHTIDAECGARQMLQLACKEPLTRNRRRRPFPLESEVPGFAEYLCSERGFAESTIRNYRYCRSTTATRRQTCRVGRSASADRGAFGHRSLGVSANRKRTTGGRASVGRGVCLQSDARSGPT
jgi:integrase/recombinase XerD